MSGRITFKYHPPQEIRDRHGGWTAYVDGEQLPCSIEGRERTDTLGMVFAIKELEAGELAKRTTVNGVKAFIRDYYIRGNRKARAADRDEARMWRWFRTFLDDLIEMKPGKVWRFKYSINPDNRFIDIDFIWRVDDTGWPEDVTYSYRYDYMGHGVDPKETARKIVEIVEDEVEPKIKERGAAK